MVCGTLLDAIVLVVVASAARMLMLTVRVTTMDRRGVAGGRMMCQWCFMLFFASSLQKGLFTVSYVYKRGKGRNISLFDFSSGDVRKLVLWPGFEIP